MRKRLRSMELAVSQLQKAPSGPGAAPPTSMPSTPPYQRSISIQNVHPAATPAVLIAHFSGYVLPFPALAHASMHTPSACVFLFSL